MATPRPRLIYCADGNPTFARLAVRHRWTYGARLPATTYVTPYFADQDWKTPDRASYMRALALHRPACATVLDWEYEEQLPEVLCWAREAARHVTESVLIVPKVVGGIRHLPRHVGGKRVTLAYSIPTSYGGSPVPFWEHGGWPVHLLGGSPQAQMRMWRYFRRVGATVVSLDGNMAGQQARQGRTWRCLSGPKGHWWQLRDLGDDRARGVDTECFRRSLIEIRRTWLGIRD